MLVAAVVTAVVMASCDRPAAAAKCTYARSAQAPPALNCQFAHSPRSHASFLCYRTLSNSSRRPRRACPPKWSA